MLKTMNAERSTPSVRGALAGLSLSMLLSSLGTSIANVGLPTLAQAFNASFQEVQWIVLAYLLAITTLIVSAGRLGDITGRRRLLLAGIFLFTAASALCGIAPTLGLLIAARAAQGLGAAIMMALTLAFVGETVPKAKTGSATLAMLVPSEDSSMESERLASAQRAEAIGSALVVTASSRVALIFNLRPSRKRAAGELGRFP